MNIYMTLLIFTIHLILGTIGLYIICKLVGKEVNKHKKLTLKELFTIFPPTYTITLINLGIVIFLTSIYFSYNRSFIENSLRKQYEDEVDKLFEHITE